MKIFYVNDEIKITDFNAVQAYKIAAKTEKEGIEFYKKVKAQAQDADLADILEFLIAEEKKHLKLFEDELFRLKAKVEDGFEEDDIVSYMDTKIFYPYNSIEELDKAISERKKAIKLAMQIEKNSIVFYGACLLNAQDKITQGMFQLILAEELNHLIKFTTLLT